MQDGTYSYYTIQHRTIAQSPHLKKTPIKLIKKKDRWHWSSWDSFGSAFNPRHGTGNNWRPVNQKADDERYSVWMKTGSDGWWTLNYAVKALHRVRKQDSKGKFDYFDTYNNHTRSVRHEFRIVMRIVSQRVIEITLSKIKKRRETRIH